MKTLQINQKSYDVLAPQDRLPFKFLQTGPNSFELIDGQNAPIRGRAVKTRDGIWIFLNGHSYFVQKPKEKRADAAHGDSESGGSGALVAPMPSKVFKLLVAKGDLVKKGQELIILEAMKMEHALHAGKDGTVSICNINEGQMVDLGQELIVVS